MRQLRAPHSPMQDLCFPLPAMTRWNNGFNVKPPSFNNSQRTLTSLGNQELDPEAPIMKNRPQSRFQHWFSPDQTRARIPPFGFRHSFLKPTVVKCSSPEGSNSDLNDDEHCKSCLYTGVATCTAVSAYFFKTALLDLPERGTPQFTKEVRNQKYFMISFGTAWAIAGVYRWYLG